MVSAGCIVCFGEVVDTLLLPCRHLVLCAVSARCGGVVEWTGRWVLMVVGVL